MWTPLNRDWTVKPPLGTPLRTDGHWSVQGLVGCWLFNEGAGGRVYDVARQNNGTANVYMWMQGGMYFYDQPIVTVPHVPILSVHDQFTILLDITWIEIAYDSVWRGLVGKDDTAGYTVYVAAGVLSAYINLVSYSSGFTLQNGKRTVCCVVACGTTLSFFADGRLVNTQNLSGQPIANTYDFYIGRTAWSSSDRFNGYIYGVNVFNRALSPNEIASLSAHPYQVCQP